ncbi:MAG: PAS domain-containing protein [Leptolyngbyaceae cyanobacterium RU_5_1]|nr:PAS domain-containing protein [Leptolyngbyaceae cyanobacterium RU_5_1]
MIGGVQLRLYGVALLCVAFALGGTLLLWRWLFPTTTPLFSVAVMISAWYGGWRAGLLATVLSTLAVNYFFIEPFYSLQILNVQTVVRLSTFLAAAGVISVLNQSRRMALKDARETLQALQAALAAIREGEERLKLAVEAGRRVAWEWNPFTNTIITTANFPEIYGLESIQTAEQGFALVHPEDRTRHQLTVENTLATGSNYQSEFRLIRPDNGAIVWLEERGQSILNSDGSLQKLIGVTIDISDRKQAETDLRLNRNRLTFVLQSTGIGLWLNPLPLGQLNWDDRTKELFFVPPDVEPTIELFWSRLHPDDREPTRLAVEDALREHALYEIDHRAVNPDTGEVRWLRSAGKATYGPDGTPIQFDGINYDISDRKQAEAALQESQARFEAFMRYSPVTAYIKDEQGRYLYVNPLNERICNRPLADWLGKTDFELFPVEAAQQSRNHDLAALEAGEAIEVAETFVQEDGEHYFTSFKFPIPQPSGGCLLGGISLNVTEHKRTEMALRDSEERTRLATTAANLGMWFWQVQANELVWTDQCKALFGLPANAEVSYETTLNLIHPDDRQLTNDAVMRTLQERVEYDVKYRVVWADGSIHWIAAQGRAFYDEQGQPIRMMGTVQDVSDRVQVERDRERILQQEQAAREIAENANRVKDEFLAVLSHELRSPLNPILGWAKLLQTGNLDEARKTQALAIIARNAKLQSELIEDLLDISRILRGKLSLNIVAVDLAATIRAAMETVQLAADAKGIDFRLEIGDFRLEDAETISELVKTTAQSLNLQSAIPNSWFQAMRLGCSKSFGICSRMR